MLLVSEDVVVKYVGMFFGVLGIYFCILNIILWMVNNIEGVYKRGVVMGFVIGWGNLNGVVSSNIFFNGLRFVEGYVVIIVYMVVFFFGGLVLMMVLLRRENVKWLRGKRDYLVEGMSEKEMERLGDRRLDFIYMV